VKINDERSNRPSLGAKRNGIYVNNPLGSVAMTPGNSFIIHSNMVKTSQCFFLHVTRQALNIRTCKNYAIKKIKLFLAPEN